MATEVWEDYDSVHGGDYVANVAEDARGQLCIDLYHKGKYLGSHSGVDTLAALKAGREQDDPVLVQVIDFILNKFVKRGVKPILAAL